MKLVQRLERLGARGVVMLPTAVVTRLAPASRVDGQELDPHLNLILTLQKRRGGFETLGGARQAREEYQHLIDLLERPELPLTATSERVVATDEAAIPVRIYQPPTSAPRPCVIYLHGGGHVIGDLRTHDRFCRRLCREVKATVIAVDYRLAPEHPFPAAVDDCSAVTRWVIDHADELGLDPARIALAGDSAGGNLAAVVSQTVGGLAFQLLIYPATEIGSATASKKLFGAGYGLDATTVAWFLRSYAAGVDLGDPRLSPATGKALAHSPPTHIATAGFDVLRDEGRAYARLLQDAGVPCTVENHSSLSHGFIHFTRLAAANTAVASLCEQLRAGLKLS